MFVGTAGRKRLDAHDGPIRIRPRPAGRRDRLFGAIDAKVPAQASIILGLSPLAVGGAGMAAS
jgi:hypothetical protein